MADSILASKAGVVVTANGYSYVIFQHGFEVGVNYSVLLTCADSTVGGECVVAYATDLANTGFTVSTFRADNSAVMSGVTVYWLAVLHSNE